MPASHVEKLELPTRLLNFDKRLQEIQSTNNLYVLAVVGIFRDAVTTICSVTKNSTVSKRVG